MPPESKNKHNSVTATKVLRPHKALKHSAGHKLEAHS